MFFLTEFLTGTQFYLFILGVFTILFWIIPQKRQWISFLVTTFLFAYMAHMIVPDVSDDLRLYFDFIDSMREGGRERFDYFVSQKDFDWHIYKVSGWFYYFLSKLPDSRYDHFLPSSVAFVTYGLNFCVINNVSKNYEVDKFHTYIGSMFFLSSYWYFDLVSGIRNGFAFGIAFASAYYFIVEKKHIVLCIIGFLIAVFFHSGGIMPIILVFMTLITIRIPGKSIGVIMVFAIAAGTVALNILSEVTDNGLIQVAAQKSEKYQDARLIETSTNYVVNIVIVVLVVIMLLYISTYLSERNELKTLKLYKLATNTMFFMVGAVAVGLIFVRFSRWILPVLGAIMFMVGFQSQKRMIEEKGISYAYYYAPTIERLKYRLRPVLIIAIVLFIAVHIWYNVNGSSLIWAHFEHEWGDMGSRYLWRGSDFAEMYY